MCLNPPKPPPLPTPRPTAPAPEKTATGVVTGNRRSRSKGLKAISSALTGKKGSNPGIGSLRIPLQNNRGDLRY